MKLQLSKSNFVKSLSFVQNIVESKATIPILANVLLEAKHKSNFPNIFFEKLDTKLQFEKDRLLIMALTSISGIFLFFISKIKLPQFAL